MNVGSSGNPSSFSKAGWQVVAKLGPRTGLGSGAGAAPCVRTKRARSLAALTDFGIIDISSRAL